MCISVHLYIMHMGEILKRVVKKVGLPISTIAERTGFSRSYFYDIFEREEIPWHNIIQIGRALNYDFKKDFPDMPIYDSGFPPIEVKDSVASYESVYELRKKLTILQEKYTALLEEHMELSKVLQEKVKQLGH